MLTKCGRGIYHPPNKYGAVKKGGYHSMKEYNRANELKLLEKAGIIQNLREQIQLLLQESFVYQGKKIQPIHYIADFVYEKNGDTMIEDVKGFKTKEYLLKIKLLKKRYPNFIFIET